jgi:hypothetical protein
MKSTGEITLIDSKLVNFLIKFRSVVMKYCCWLLAAGFWRLASGGWLLVAGCWLLVVPLCGISLRSTGCSAAGDWFHQHLLPLILSDYTLPERESLCGSMVYFVWF